MVDKYAAYEIYASQNAEISGDLELIQNEGLNAIRQVDPNMVVKKKNGKDIEVQEGWKGHILPFDLVQKTLLKDELTEISGMHNQLAEIPGEYESVLEEMSDDEKEIVSDALNEDNTEFVLKNVSVVRKKLKKENSSEYAEVIEKLIKVEEISKSEKQLKSDVKTKEIELHEHTKATIEKLCDVDISLLLQSKWILPISEGINGLVTDLLNELEKEIETLTKKYTDTYQGIEEEIQKTQNSLADMMSELVGSEYDIAGINEFQKLLRGEQ